jgi:hypothetical protein
MISFGKEGLRLTADTDISINTDNVPLPVTTEQQDDILYMTVKVVQLKKHHTRVAVTAQEKQLKQKGGE